MRRQNEKGSALVFALILVLVLSVMAGSLMFLARSETWSGMSYRMMTQTRYGAEAGVNATSNFLMSANYVPPIAIGPTYPSSNFVGYDTTKYPLQLTGGGNVYLSTLTGQASTYPNALMQTAFANAVNGTLQAGNTNVNYTASAQLMSMVTIIPFGTTTPVTVQTWQITAHGDIPGVLNAESEVVTTLEHYTSPAFAYAAFAAGNGCGQLSFTGNGTTDSYDSASLTPNGGTINPANLGTASDPFNLFGGNLGTNGNDSNSGANVTINGNLSVPNPTYGVCSAGNVTGLSGGNPGQVTGGFVQLSAPVTFPPPSITAPLPGTPNTTPGCTLNPCDISLAGSNTITLTPGTYTVNSISMAGNSQIIIAPNPVTGQYGPVILNVVSDGTSTPITIAGNGIGNPTYDPSMFQILCCGPTAPSNPTIKIAGNGASAAAIYAPNATASFKGNGQFFGSVIANQLTDVGNGAIHYDLNLQKKMFTVGQYTLQSFTWNKF
jgi:hypothetical protein